MQQEYSMEQEYSNSVLYPTSEYPIHSIIRPDGLLLVLNREFKNLLRHVVFISRNDRTAVLSFYLVNFGVQG